MRYLLSVEWEVDYSRIGLYRTAQRLHSGSLADDIRVAHLHRRDPRAPSAALHTRMKPITEVGLRIDMGFTVVATGVITGSPMSGAILDGTGSFKDVGYAKSVVNALVVGGLLGATDKLE
ncbi:hypothetical protein LXA43DRAFT_1099515 [Ganoderma leucocontextum]|nr:hypothetical protein LXA43DRAFT_1099515 [Ganoderma leucocontextum]